MNFCESLLSQIAEDAANDAILNLSGDIGLIVVFFFRIYHSTFRSEVLHLGDLGASDRHFASKCRFYCGNFRPVWNCTTFWRQMWNKPLGSVLHAKLLFYSSSAPSTISKCREILVRSQICKKSMKPKKKESMLPCEMSSLYVISSANCLCIQVLR